MRKKKSEIKWKRGKLYSHHYTRAVRRVSRKTYTDKHNIHYTNDTFRYIYGWIVGGMDVYCSERYMHKENVCASCSVTSRSKKKSSVRKKAIPSYNPVNDRAIFYLLLQLSRSVYIKYTWEACTSSPTHSMKLTFYRVGTCILCMWV